MYVHNTNTNTNKTHSRRYGTADQSTCQHSLFYGAYNYVTLSIKPTLELAAGSTITISGITSPMESGTVSVLLRDIVSTAPGVIKSLNGLCVCTAPGCTCEYTFVNVPKVAQVKLQAKIQCNAYGWGTEGGQNITVRVGFNKTITNRIFNISNFWKKEFQTVSF